MGKLATTEEKILQKAKEHYGQKKDEALCRNIIENQKFESLNGELS